MFSSVNERKLRLLVAPLAEIVAASALTDFGEYEDEEVELLLDKFVGNQTTYSDQQLALVFTALAHKKLPRAYMERWLAVMLAHPHGQWGNLFMILEQLPPEARADNLRKVMRLGLSDKFYQRAGFYGVLQRFTKNHRTLVRPYLKPYLRKILVSAQIPEKYNLALRVLPLLFFNQESEVEEDSLQAWYWAYLAKRWRSESEAAITACESAVLSPQYPNWLHVDFWRLIETLKKS